MVSFKRSYTPIRGENSNATSNNIHVIDTKLPLAQLASVVPDHSNLIFIYARYTLDEIIFKAMYEQDTLFYEAMEPLTINTSLPDQNDEIESRFDGPAFCYMLTENKLNGRSGTAYFAENYDEVPPESIKLNRPSHEVIVSYQKQIRMWNNLDSISGETPTDEYLLSTFDPLTPMRFIDPNAGIKGTKDVNTLPPEVAAECRNMAKIKIAGTEVKLKTKSATLENMFTRQVEKQIRQDKDERESAMTSAF